VVRWRGAGWARADGAVGIGEYKAAREEWEEERCEREYRGCRRRLLHAPPPSYGWSRLSACRTRTERRKDAMRRGRGWQLLSLFSCKRVKSCELRWFET